MYGFSGLKSKATCSGILVGRQDKAVSNLKQMNIKIESFEGLPQDESGIVRGKAHGMGPDLALFRDPAGNLLTVAEE